MAEKASALPDVDSPLQVKYTIVSLLSVRLCSHHVYMSCCQAESSPQQIDLLQLAQQLADLPARHPVTDVLEGWTLQRKQIMRYMHGLYLRSCAARSPGQMHISSQYMSHSTSNHNIA